MKTKREKGFYEKYIKTPQDVILAAVALFVLSPVLLLVAIFVRTQLGSPVIFKQKRAGKGGKPYYIYKTTCQNKFWQVVCFFEFIIANLNVLEFQK